MLKIREKKKTWIRTCKYCGKWFKATGKGGKVCDKCLVKSIELGRKKREEARRKKNGK